jgi:glucose-1-phosphate adenylyltransferase
LKTLTLILAGGAGEELSVLTRHRAKTAVPFGGRYRVVDFCLSNCVHSDLHDIAVLAQYSPKSLIDHIGMGKPWDLDRRTGGVSVLLPTHSGEAANWYIGTADALYQNIDLIRNSRADTILVLSGDQIYVMDYRPLLRYHAEKGTAATLAIAEVQASRRSRFGMVRRSRDGIVTAFREKPAASTFRFASLGIYVFRRDFLLDVLAPGKWNIVFDVVMPLLKRNDVAGYVFEGYWEDIGSIESYYQSSLELLQNRRLITDPDWPIYTMGSGLPPARCAAGSRVSDSIIADGCIVRGSVSGSILFPGVTIERGASVRDSIVFSYSRVGVGARVTRAILDKFVLIGEEAVVGGAARASGKPASAGGMRRGAEGERNIAVLGRGARVTRGGRVPAGARVEPHERIGGRRRS